MRNNWDTQIIGSKIKLVPYRVEHVEQYHQWMQDPYLQAMTASDPLSLEEEYRMQQSWLDDDQKCTFIVLDKHRSNDADVTSGMVGDVNLFFNDDENPSNCEIEIMIAESTQRRQGFALEALNLMMAYGVVHLNVTRYYCKISDDNHPSIALFTKKYVDMRTVVFVLFCYHPFMIV